MKRILICGYYGYANSGDDAILASINDDIKSLGPEYSITILSNNPSETEKDYGVSAINRFCIRDVLREMKSCDIFLLGGGTLIQDDSSSRSLFYYLGLILISKIMKKKCMLYANGIGMIRKCFNSFITMSILNGVDIITLREGPSKKSLDRMKVTKPHIKITSDPVFNLEIKETNIEEIFKSEGISRDKPLIAVAFRTWQDDKHYSEVMCLICDEIIERFNMNILFIPMNPVDITVSERIRQGMQHDSFLLKGHYRVNEIINIIGSCHLVLGMRLHALIYSAIKNVPMIGFAYNPKVTYYTESLKMPLFKDINKIEKEEVLLAIEDIHHKNGEYRRNLENKVILMKELAKQNILLLKEL